MFVLFYLSKYYESYNIYDYRDSYNNLSRKKCLCQSVFPLTESCTGPLYRIRVRRLRLWMPLIEEMMKPERMVVNQMRIDRTYRQERLGTRMRRLKMTGYILQATDAPHLSFFCACGDDLCGTARFHIAGAVRDKDVKEFRGTYALEDLEAEPFFSFAKYCSMASTSPGMSYLFASVDTWRPCTSSVFVVTGPMEAIITSFRMSLP